MIRANVKPWYNVLIPSLGSCRCLACRLPYDDVIVPVQPNRNRYRFVVDAGVTPAEVRMTEHGRLAVPYETKPREYRGNPNPRTP